MLPSTLYACYYSDTIFANYTHTLKDIGMDEHQEPSYWHIIYEVSGRPPYLRNASRSHRKDVGFKAPGGEFPIGQARKDIEFLHTNNAACIFNFGLDAIVSWTRITADQYREMETAGKTVSAEVRVLRAMISAAEQRRQRRPAWFLTLKRLFTF